jgi:hypothetical protein
VCVDVVCTALKLTMFLAMQMFRNVDVCSRAERVVWTSSSNVGNWIYLHRLAFGGQRLAEVGMVNYDDSFLSLDWFYGGYKYPDDY